jgi:formylglycine-generating enzyme required for sulfatase activity
LSASADPSRDDDTVFTIYLDEAKQLPMQFCCMPAGSFWMGSRGYDANGSPRHQVTLSKFYLGQFPVTQAQYRVWTASDEGQHYQTEHNHQHKNHFERPGYEQHPAENMSWDEALAFCQWLQHSVLSLPVNAHHSDCFVTLPTEAQWEYACRGEVDQPVGRAMEYYHGDGEAALRQVGWFDEEWDEGSTHPVGELIPNKRGLYDMHGQVWEWCLDAWDEHAYQHRPAGVHNPLVLSEQKDDLLQQLPSALLLTYSLQRSGNANRVVRGGSWFDAAGGCRAASRLRRGPGIRGRRQGFRVCLVPDPAIAEQQSASQMHALRSRLAACDFPRLLINNEYQRQQSRK